MTELAIAENTGLRCLDIEISRAGDTYSYETLEQLNRDYPECEFFFILGADCLFAMENWGYSHGQASGKTCGFGAPIRRKNRTSSVFESFHLLYHNTGTDPQGIQCQVYGTGQGTGIYGRKGILP